MKKKLNDPLKDKYDGSTIIKSFEILCIYWLYGYLLRPVLIDPDETVMTPIHGLSLYPRHFIKSLKRPQGYFGPEAFFRTINLTIHHSLLLPFLIMNMRKSFR